MILVLLDTNVRILLRWIKRSVTILVNCLPTATAPANRCPRARSPAHVAGKKQFSEWWWVTLNWNCQLFSEGEEAGFICAFEECKEAAAVQEPDTAHQFTIDSCCATSIVRGEEAIDKLPRCWNDGHEYVLGNLIYSPRSPCFKCICDDKYDNATDPAVSSSCKKVDCGIELHQLSYIQNGGVPVYLSNGFCCPFEFRNRKFTAEQATCTIEIFILFLFFAENEKDVLVRAANPSSSAADQGTCSYGKIKMAIGDTIKTDDPCLECSCTAPPLAHCIRTIHTEQCH